MISPFCDLNEFVEAVRNRDYYEVLYLAEREATAAERLRLRRQNLEYREQHFCPRYADSLKGFISFLRYGVQTSFLEKDDLELFRSLRARLIDTESSEETDS
ncbi:MAG: hypothetical protein JXL84_17890 [Deltaproteobacteria bacterium]|nr:hypothetical protein [Deltaproteobacteria bacterium]